MIAGRQEHGYVALMAVLIVGAACTAIALSLLLTGTDIQRGTLASQQTASARQLANACVEEALQRIQTTSSYTGSGSLTPSTGNCSYTVTSTGAQTRTIDASGAVNNITSRLKVYATIGSSSISITSWQEVSDL